MIHIDTVYQRVLALANKEQRGYITPLEYNLLANQAQQIIFEQYFYDLDQAKRGDSDKSSFSDMEELIKNKLAPFIDIGIVEDGTTFPRDIPAGAPIGAVGEPGYYRTGKIYIKGYEARRVSSNEFTNIQFSRFHAHGLKRNPIYRDSAIQDEDVEVFNGTATSELSAGDITVEIIKRPEKAEWGYDVIAEKALYNASRSTNYQLHDSEETELVYKILALAGVIIKRVDIQQAAQGLDISKIQQEKA